MKFLFYDIYLLFKIVKIRIKNTNRVYRIKNILLYLLHFKFINYKYLVKKYTHNRKIKIRTKILSKNEKTY